jgi:hypothetical protein
MTSPLLKNLIHFALPSILAVEVTWGMQIARIELLEKELHSIRTALGSHQKDEHIDSIVVRLEHQLEGLVSAINHIERRLGRQ